MIRHRDDPIIAIATPAGRGGIGVVRIAFGRWSGERVVAAFVAKLCGRIDALVPRHATLVGIRAADGATIDRGIALLFVAPHSYTGDDVLELQLHGGPVVLQMIVARCLAVAEQVVGDQTADEPLSRDVITQVITSGPHATRVRMRLAEAGEFTERAFLNGRLDLAQAEAVADLIEASSEAAVLGAQASLAGAFSTAVGALVERTIALRALVEATLDFPEEEIDFLEASDARGRLASIRAGLAALMRQAQRGAVLREGLTVVLIGRPNVGKSSLLNALAEADVAIVTPIAGTTRDRVEETIRLEGIAFHVVDTAGIRTLDEKDDRHTVERLGIARTWAAVERAHVVLHLVEEGVHDRLDPDDEAIVRRLPTHAARRTIVNKIDLHDDIARVEVDVDRKSARIHLSAKTGAGIDLLRADLLAIAGWQPSAETGFIARERHLVALRAAAAHLDAAGVHADTGDRELDLFAEELRRTQIELDRITGTFSADDLLGEIFGKFCIGK